MQNFIRIPNISRKLRYLFSISLIVLISGCSKKNENTEKIAEVQKDVYSYEVTCNACEIKFTNQNKENQQVYNSNGKWSYSLKDSQASDLKINIKTTQNAYQNISAYILKNEEVIYGDLGYNTFEILYNIPSGKKSMNFGSYNSGSTVPPTGSTGTQPTQPTSSLCGARTQAGGFCKRVVLGGGRCWQHR